MPIDENGHKISRVPNLLGHIKTVVRYHEAGKNMDRPIQILNALAALVQEERILDEKRST